MPAPLPPGIPTSNLVLLLQTTDSPAAYNIVANLGDYTGPQSTSTVVDVSKHGDKFRRKLKTLLDSGILATPCWFDPSLPTHAGNSQALLELYQNQTALETWLVAFVDDTGTIIPPSPANNGPQFYFNAYVTKFSLKEPVAGVYAADLELTIDGAVTPLWETTVMPAGQRFDHA